MTNSYLPHKSVPWQASTSPLDAACSVQSLGTTAINPEPLGNPEWMADLEYVWRSRTEDARRALDARARRLQLRARRVEGGHKVKLLRRAEWAQHRARALAMSRADIVAACGKRWRAVRCGCGTKEIRVGCDATSLCPTCRKKHWRKWRHRITRAMDIHLRAARAAWNRHGRRLGGMLPGVYLITLTGPHTGDIESDRRTMGDAWRTLTKAAHAGRWWSAYALTWEVTRGTEGDGHVHAHVAVISSWLPYEELHAAWRHAMPGARVLDVQAPNRQRNEAGSAANYLAKDVTKGVDPAEMSGRKAGELLCAFRGRRKVTTSARFWSVHERTGVCPTCKVKHRSVGAPKSLQSITPGAVFRAMAESVGWWIPRGAPQVSLRWDGS